MNLDGYTKDSLWKALHQQTRWSINRTMKYKMQIKELSIDELDVFVDIMNQTGQRRGFETRNLEFYKCQMEAYKERLKCKLAYIDTSLLIQSLEKEKEEIEKEIDELNLNGVRIRTLGELSAFKPGLRSLMEDAVERTKHNTGLCFNIAVNYGSRDEIVHAVRRIAAEGIAPDAVTEQTIADRLYTSGLPELDLIIRTAGEERLSNFLLWQAAYAEFVFSKTLWPDFTPEVYFGCLREFLNRTRRFGRVL